MNNEKNTQPGDLDSLIGDNHLQMMKAALPYMSVTEQRFISLFVKFNELRRTVKLFEDEEVAAMGICSAGEETGKAASPLDMLGAIKPFGTPPEQDLIDLVMNFFQGFRLANAVSEAVPGSTVPGCTDLGSAASGYSAPGCNAPGYSSPGSAASGYSASGYSSPSSATSGYSSPGCNAPGSAASGYGASGYSAPGSAIPGSAASGSAASGSTVTGTAVPDPGSSENTARQTPPHRSAGPFGRMSFDQIKNFIPPEQQSRLETMQMMMSAMQQMN